MLVIHRRVLSRGRTSARISGAALTSVVCCTAIHPFSSDYISSPVGARAERSGSAPLRTAITPGELPAPASQSHSREQTGEDRPC